MKNLFWIIIVIALGVGIYEWQNLPRIKPQANGTPTSSMKTAEATPDEPILQFKRRYEARVTMYSPKESCHNPIKVIGTVTSNNRSFKNGEIKCLTASGAIATEGVTVACPEKVKIGSIVMIFVEGEPTIFRKCQDQYSDWVQEKFGDTYDIFTENQSEAMNFGSKKMMVSVYE